ncbi:hypothetical protein QN366_04905 [Pseudomonas sp. CCC3.2]|uniref:hypothetical protein n=1 Tax=unclassified Pseudomonas TaxID=196821 RepID=UPI002AB52328|nr:MULTISPECIES: hypothetical protein [unclassified Pseudomonas]MDY7559947.1 hypothetical protein [Pseudomonas sp. AB6]MEB0179413.1 hypothetical protein [Pseudomonas sp. CCC3.2]MEB0210479.1 hypothetical protein [Pseudomonas sp. AB6]
MNLEFFSSVVIAIISAWAVWCCLSRKVNDGIAGKLIYAVIAVSGYAIVTRTETMFFSPSVAGVTFHAGLAMAGLRHYFLVNHWVKVKAWMCRYLHCESCANQVGDKELK